MVVIMPSKPNFQRPPPLAVPLPSPTTDPHDNMQTIDTPDITGSRKRRRSLDDDATTEESEDEMPKTRYQCRFCNMWFDKSQALGGHMNRHRQEREREQFQRAHQLMSSLVQQPRSWSTLADPSGAGASQITLSTHVAMRAPSPRVQPQVPSICFGSTRVPSTTTPDSQMGSYSSPSNSIQQWNVDGMVNPNLANAIPRSGSQLQSPNALDPRNAGIMRDEYLSSVVQHRHAVDGGAFGGAFGSQTSFHNPPATPLLNSRAGLGAVAPNIFQESFQGVSNALGNVSSGLDHQNIRQNDATRPFTSSNVDVRPAVMRAPVSSPTVMMQLTKPQKWPLGNAAGTGMQYHAMQATMQATSGTFPGHAFNLPGPAGAHGGAGFGCGQTQLPGTVQDTVQDFTLLQDSDANNVGGLVQSQYGGSRPPMTQTSSGSATSDGFNGSASHEPADQAMRGLVKVRPESGAYCPQPSQMISAAALQHLQNLNPTAAVHEVDGNKSESMNMSAAAESADVSGMSWGAPERHQSADYSSGRTHNVDSPFGQANNDSPPSQEYGSD